MAVQGNNDRTPSQRDSYEPRPPLWQGRRLRSATFNLADVAARRSRLQTAGVRSECLGCSPS